MNYVEPILYIAGEDEIFILRHTDEKIKEDFDIMVPYEYQKKHIELILNYIAPHYYDMCPHKARLNDYYDLIATTPYEEYFKLFMIKFLQENKIYNMGDFMWWLKKEHPIYIKKRNINVLRYFEVKRYYNTIVIDLDINNGNRWNKTWNLPPNLFNDSIIFKTLEYLTEGGKLIFLHKKGHYNKIFDYTKDGFKEIEEGYYIKEKTPKNEFNLPRKWL